MMLCDLQMTAALHDLQLVAANSPSSDGDDDSQSPNGNNA
ncbi:hypothetical protein TIFTF001_004073 [Ficus carica]|uniref:Uncharacterized protein n=1 Tax=Ficus carica TaxID=3494 RepID=A0AA88CWK5_FICCA|nr:hypothetical protein TIFTF001_004073 [Ficus carica]